MNQRYLFMYCGYSEPYEYKMYEYVLDFFGPDVVKLEVLDNKDYGLYVREDMYEYVYATLNSHAVYDEGNFGYTIHTLDDCKKWKQKQLDVGNYILSP